MRFAVSYNTAAYGTDPDDMARVARHAEACGFEAVLFPEHLVLHPGVTFGGFEVPSTLAVADPLACLTFVAAATDRILLGTGVLLLPYRHPVVLAKQLATIDLLSGGRLQLLTVGLGIVEREAQATGIDFATRGRRADAVIDVLRLLWTGGADGVSYRDEFFAFDDICVFPQPARGRIPIHVGGSSGSAARRAGLRGDGYFPGGRLTPTERLGQLEIMRSSARIAGRDPEALQYTRWGSVDLTPAEVEAFTAQGVDRLVMSPSVGRVEEQLDELSAFAERHLGG